MLSDHRHHTAGPSSSSYVPHVLTREEQRRLDCTSRHICRNIFVSPVLIVTIVSKNSVDEYKKKHPERFDGESHQPVVKQNNNVRSRWTTFKSAVTTKIKK